jgi:diguanylate cyclase (GGDEF)-like protein
MGSGVRSGRPGSPAVVAVVTLVLLGQIVATGTTGLWPYIFVASVVALDILGVIYSLRATRRGDAAAWWLSAAARAFSLISIVGLAVAGPTGSLTAWWAGTVARLVMYLLLAATVLIAPAQRLTGRRRYAFLADAATVLGGGFMVVWYFNITPIADGFPASFRWVSAIGNPIGDLLLLMAIALVLMRGSITRATSPMALYLFGLACYLVGDAAWPSAGPDGIRAPDSRFSSYLLVAAALLLTVAPMTYRPRGVVTQPSWQERKRENWVVLLPLIALGVGCSLLLIVTIRENDMLPWGGLVLGLIVMAVAVAVRQMISLRDKRDLIVSDALTGLANRRGLNTAINRAARRRDRTALLLIDLDGFKLINDAYGHAAGDTVLTDFAHHLSGTVRAGDVAARIGGDEFAVLLTEVTTPEQAGLAAQRILAAAAANPLRLGADIVPIRASIGITLGLPDDTTQELVRRADMAMYQAKRAGTHGWMLHDPSMTDRRAEDAALTEDLAKALANHELYVLYQPIVDLTDGHPIACEALLRWQHPTRGVVSPVQFIPIAERSGAITAIGLWVLEQACAQLHTWHRERPAGQPLHMSVNLSPRQLREPALVPAVLAILQRTGVDPADLVLEVTESAIVDQSAIAVLSVLRGHGIRVAIDDFGTGYSSLHYLTRLPVDILKIDRSFVAELNGTPAGSAVTEAVIRLSQVLNLVTVAEGIESAEQATELQLLGCDTGQGYLFSRPRPAAELHALVTAARTVAS